MEKESIARWISVLHRPFQIYLNRGFQFQLVVHEWEKNDQSLLKKPADYMKCVKKPFMIAPLPFAGAKEEERKI